MDQKTSDAIRQGSIFKLKSKELTDLIDIASERAGGQVIYASSEKLAPASNLLKDKKGGLLPVTPPAEGKFFDGWVTARHGHLDPKRENGDYCIIKLGMPGLIQGFDIDTSGLDGNHAEHVSVEGICVEGNPPWYLLDQMSWTELVKKKALDIEEPHNLEEIKSDDRFTHIRLTIYPDGGIARFKCYGVAEPDWAEILELKQVVDLAGAAYGGLPLYCSRRMFCGPVNLIMPGRGINCADGWETHRNRLGGKDHRDSVIIKLGAKGFISGIEVDTNHYLHNAPGHVSIEGCNLEEEPAAEDVDEEEWKLVLDKTVCEGNSRQLFQENDLQNLEMAFTHVRLNMFPDGGLTRLRVYGTPQFVAPTGPRMFY